MKPKPPGTILPTAASMRATSAHAKRVKSAQLQTAHEKGLTKYVARVVGGELRYYDGERLYAIVNRSLQVLWFEVRDDGDYPVSRAAKHMIG